MENDIWMEGADSRECDDCGHTSHTCTCYKNECYQCNKVIRPAKVREWNEDYFCDETCINLFLNE